MHVTGLPHMTYEVDITANTPCVDVDLAALRQALIQSLHSEAVAEAVLSVSLVDNATIHEINRQYLRHDYPTDVISFPLEWTHPTSDTPGRCAEQRSAGAHIEGEIVASVEFARSEAEQQGWELQSELTLCLVHGMLHLCGYDDLNSAEKQIMRARESAVLSQLGVQVIPGHNDDAGLDFSQPEQEDSE